MKMTKRERKAYNKGKRAGFNDGYIKGLHDGNPFTVLAETAAEIGRKMCEIMSDPEFKNALIEAQQLQDNEGLIIEDDDNEDY